MEIKISEEDKALLKQMASEILCDKNRLAKAIAVHVRNGIENFHWKYLSDDNMREINPKIRNAIYTFLVDLGDKVDKVSMEDDANTCFDYVIANTYDYLIGIGISDELSNKFYEEVLSRLYQSFYEISDECTCNLILTIRIHVARTITSNIHSRITADIQLADITSLYMELNL
ncbi:hypothetical protein [Phocaeicola vulgatus]|uniref:hypothetical protein n=1 Tax=Phocaeicola vulgatus TaxID=821 RepID=UPI00189C0EC0|nr:hypothetical protein [Phocaeicola vulgatus]